MTNERIRVVGGAPEPINARGGAVRPGATRAGPVEARTDTYLGAQLPAIVTPTPPPPSASRLRRVDQAYRFELDPNDRERRVLASHAGGSRYAWNWGRDRVLEAIAQKAAGDDVRLPNAMALNKQWNEWKQCSGEVDWWPANSKCVYQEAFRDLEAALKAHWESRDGRRKGERVGFPRFKTKSRSPAKFRLYGTFYVHHRHVYLPRLGAIRIKESGSKLAEGVAAGMIGIKSASIRREADRWFVSFQVQALRPEPARAASGPHIGIDVGLSTFATFSDGRSIQSPKALASNLRKLRRLSREHSRTQKGSARRRKAALRLARHHMKIRNVRRDHLHKLTTQLAKSQSRFVVEDLAVRNMVKNRHLARAISDASWSEFRRMLEYKAQWYGSEVVAADRWFASSKRCSGCGEVNPSLTLGDRTFRCECGLVVDRDLNAARNLALYPPVGG